MELAPHTKRDAVVVWFIILDAMVGLTSLYLLATMIEVRIVALVLLVLVLAYAGWFYYLYSSPFHRLRRELHELQELVGTDALDELKEHYDEVYSLYLRLPEHLKRQVFGRLMKLRGAIEESLTAEKKLRQLMEHADRGTLPVRKKRYREMYELYLKLPAPAQGKFYEEMKLVRERLQR